jgi:hypothetical protein
MRFLDKDECIRHCGALTTLGTDRLPSRELPGRHRLRVNFPSKPSQYLWFSRTIESALAPRSSMLVWVTEWGVFPSSQNLHLYYRFKQAYGDLRLLHEAPGHLCLDFEAAEVTTLVYLAILFGWDAHLIPTAGYARAFVYHHDWAEIAFDDASKFQDTCRAFADAGLDLAIPDGTDPTQAT